MMSLSADKDAEIIEAVNSTSRYLDDLSLGLHFTVLDGFVSSKIYDKRDDFDFANFPFLDGDIPCATSYGVYM